MKKKWKTGVLIGTGLGAILTNSLYGVSSYIIWKTMHPKRRPITNFPSDYNMEYQDITFKSADGINLKGWWLPVENSSSCVIFSHAYGFNRSSMPFDVFSLVKYIQHLGFNVLLYDLRNSGESEGTKTTLAHKEQYDVLGAIEFSKTEKSMKRIVLMGWSMGASASLLAGCISQDVKEIVADSPFSDLDSYLMDSFEYWTKLPKFVGKLGSYMMKMNPFEFKPHEVKPIEIIKNAQDKRIYIIHAKDDQAISCKESEKMKNSCSIVDLWQPEKGSHIESYRYNKQEYEKRIKQFLGNG